MKFNTKEIKSLNQGYNRLLTHYQPKLPKKQFSSRHIDRLWMKRELKLKAHLHQTTSFLSQLFDEMAIEKVFIGHLNRLLDSGIHVTVKAELCSVSG